MWPVRGLSYRHVSLCTRPGQVCFDYQEALTFGIRCDQLHIKALTSVWSVGAVSEIVSWTLSATCAAHACYGSRHICWVLSKEGGWMDGVVVVVVVDVIIISLYKKPSGQAVEKADEQEVAEMQRALWCLRNRWRGKRKNKATRSLWSSASKCHNRVWSPSACTADTCRERAGRFYQNICIVLPCLCSQCHYLTQSPELKSNQ